jgi:hypothetical protein
MYKIRTMRKISGLAAVVLALVLAMLVAPVASAAPAKPKSLAACKTTVDIGVTVFSNGYVKGSGSYTTQSCLAIDSVYLVIMGSGGGNGGWGELSQTKVTRRPPEPSSAQFSPKDYNCRDSTRWYRYYKTKITWTYVGGGGGEKHSNTIHIPCI